MLTEDSLARQPDGPPPEPVAQKLRIRYAKRGRLRFTSHRDFQRALERALRRAEIPMAYSAGFNPHPKISFANAAPTGSASEAEYLEIGVVRRLDPEKLRVVLDAALPPGLDILEVVEVGSGSLVERLEASVWEIELPGVSEQELRTAVAEFLAADSVEVSRVMKNGPRTFDARGAVLSATVLTRNVPPPVTQTLTLTRPLVQPTASARIQGLPQTEPGRAGENITDRVAKGSPTVCAILRLVVRHSTPAVRPDDVLAALRSQAHLAPPSPPRMTRLAQGPLDEGDGAVADPLTADRDTAGA